MQENQNGSKDMGFEQTNRGQKDDFDSIGFNPSGRSLTPAR